MCYMFILIAYVVVGEIKDFSNLFLKILKKSSVEMKYVRK